MGAPCEGCDGCDGPLRITQNAALHRGPALSRAFSKPGNVCMLLSANSLATQNLQGLVCRFLRRGITGDLNHRSSQMPFEKGHEKIGGRQRGRPKGSLGRKSQLARDLCEKLNFDPLEALLKLCKSRKYSAELRAGWMADCLPYIHAKLSTTFVSAKVDSMTTVTHQLLDLAHKDPALAMALETLSLRMGELEREAVANQAIDATSKPPALLLEAAREPSLEVGRVVPPELSSTEDEDQI